MTEVHRLGVTLLSAGDGDSGDHRDLNIIFIHGLRGHPRGTWTHRQSTSTAGRNKDTNARSDKRTGLKSLFNRDKSKKEKNKWEQTSTSVPTEIFWPEDYLVPDLPQARIWTYGYNADVIGGLFQANNKNSVSQHGSDLAIKLDREIDNEDPIVFVVHSLGGIIVKDALHKSVTICKRTRLIIFLGTPHRGSSYAGWGEIASNLASLALQDSNKRLVQTLEVNGEVLDIIHDEFKNTLSKYPIKVHSFQEAKGVSGMKGLDNKVVDNFSSKLDLAREQETVETIDANNIEMARCSSRDDARYRQVYGVLKHFIRTEISNAQSGGNLSKEVDNFFYVPLDSENQTCLQDLRTTDPREDKKRIQDTKGGILKDSYTWVLENSKFRQWNDGEHSQLLWIRGDPGKGKTMLLCGIIDKLKETANAAPASSRCLMSYFFCQATDLRINNATAVLRGLIYLLADQQPSLLQHVRKKYDATKKELFVDTNAWYALSEIFMNILQDPSLERTYVVIDALDECVTGLQQLLQLIDKTSPTCPRVKWIISSRNWLSIEEQLDLSDQKFQLQLELNQDSISAAVTTYIGHKVGKLAKRKNYTAKSEKSIREYLSLNADATFLWVALVLKELEMIDRRFALERVKMFPPGLGPVYKQMMDQVSKSNNADICKRILSIVAVVRRPITLQELVSLDDTLHKLDCPEDLSEDLKDLEQRVGQCGSFLTIRDSTVYFVHQSAKDFLLQENTSQEIFRSGIGEVHHAIFSRSLQVMSLALRRDVYCLRAPGIIIDQVKQPDPDPLAAVRYFCLYWVDHLLECQSTEDTIKDLKDSGQVYSFLCQYFLYWLEALSLLRSVSEGIVIIKKLEDLQFNGSPDLSAFIHDARRFAVSTRSIIEQAPLQAYCSALVFAPEKSIVREAFESCIPPWIQTKPRVETHWNAMLQTLEGHTDAITSVAFSPDGKQIVSGSRDKTVRRWDAATGQQLLPALEGHTDAITSVAFSPDGKQIPTLHVSENWLADGTTNLLWLPTGYRPTCQAAWGGIIALGLSSGGLSVLQVSTTTKLVI